MNHIVVLDKAAKELENLLRGKKQMILRGSMSKMVPYKKIKIKDILFLVGNNRKNEITASCEVKEVYFTNKLSVDESFALIDKFQSKLLLNTALKKRYVGKQYLSLITVENVKLLQEPLRLLPSFYLEIKKIDWITNAKTAINKEIIYEI